MSSHTSIQTQTDLNLPARQKELADELKKVARDFKIRANVRRRGIDDSTSLLAAEAYRCAALLLADIKLKPISQCSPETQELIGTEDTFLLAIPDDQLSSEQLTVTKLCQEAMDVCDRIKGNRYTPGTSTASDLEELLRIAEHLDPSKPETSDKATERVEAEPAAKVGEPETDGALAPKPIEPVSDDAMLSPAKMAEIFGLLANALRMRLNRFRKHHLDGWTEVTERRSRESKYLYRYGAVKHIIENMRATTQTTSERPAKQNSLQ